jgi:hypothetical protein
MEECASFLAAMRQSPPSRERNVPRWGFEKLSNGHDISTSPGLFGKRYPARHSWSRRWPSRERLHCHLGRLQWEERSLPRLPE